MSGGMEKMEKQFLKRFYGTLAAALLFAACIVILFDPFYHYHDAIGTMKHVLLDRDYQVAGTLDHFTYDAVLLGTSVAENNDLTQFSERFGITAVKAIRAAGVNADFVVYLDRAFRHQQLKRVFYYIDYLSLESEVKTTFDRMDTKYVTNTNPFDDLKYLLNKDVLLKNVPLQLAYSYALPYDEANPYSWYESKTFSTEAVKGRYYPMDAISEERFDEAAWQNFKENLSMITERVKAHPETKFDFVFSPVSILWWDDAYRQGLLEQKLSELGEFVSAMGKYPNVTIHCFQNDQDMTENLDHYMDTVHFSYEINRRLCDHMADETNVITAENCQEYLDEIRQMVEEFSREGILKYYPEAVVR